MIHGKRVLVVGGAGFLGSHLSALLSTRNRVTVIDDFSTGARQNLKGVPCRLIAAGAWGPKALRTLREGRFDFIVNLAANAYIKTSVDDPALDFKKNVAQPFALLEAVRGLLKKPKILFASSAAVYGPSEKGLLREGDPCGPVSPYGVGKRAAEEYHRIYHSLYGVPTLSARFFPMYGPRQRKQVIYDTLRKLHSPGRELVLFGTGREARDFTYVEDAARAVACLLSKGTFHGGVVHLCSGRGIAIRRVAESLAEAMGVKKRIRFSGTLRPGDVDRMVGSNAVLKRLDFKEVVSFEEGIRKTVEWFIRNH